MKGTPEYNIKRLKQKIVATAERELEFTPDERLLLGALLGNIDADFPKNSEELRLSLRARYDRASRLIALLEDEESMGRVMKVARRWMREMRD